MWYHSVMFSTTFTTVNSLLASTSRAAEFVRSGIRNESIDEMKIRNRSNYTRIESGETWAFVADVPVGGLRIETKHGGGKNWLANVWFRCIYSDNLAKTAMTADEMRRMAYTMLAAANSLDGRDCEQRQKARKPKRVTA